MRNDLGRSGLIVLVRRIHDAAEECHFGRCLKQWWDMQTLAVGHVASVRHTVPVEVVPEERHQEVARVVTAGSE